MGFDLFVCSRLRNILHGVLPLIPYRTSHYFYSNKQFHGNANLTSRQTKKEHPMKTHVVLMVALCLGLVVVAQAPAQSNEFLDQVLSEQELSYGSGAYLLLASAGLVPEESTPEEALSYLSERQIALPGKSPETPLSLGEYSFLVMQIYELSGGLMYRILPSPRYASRELSHRGIIQGRAYPGMSISAERGMRILGRVLQLDERGML